MANSAQARKRARQNDTRRLRNHSQLAAMRTSVKKFVKNTSTTPGDKPDAAVATASYRKAVSMIDRAARKGQQHKNRAARLKSHLNKRLRDATSGDAPSS